MKVSKGAKITNRYNQVPHLTQDESHHETKRKKWCYAYANNRDANQPAHPRSLISVFIIRYLSMTLLLFSG